MEQHGAKASSGTGNANASFELVAVPSKSASGLGNSRTGFISSSSLSFRRRVSSPLSSR
jgi:hypothetical protein